MSIDYSDGKSIEGKILSLVRDAKDRGSLATVAAEHYEEWPVEYHLSPERANLVRHLDFAGLDVLELGAGMGAVSRHLAENAKSLTVIEGTEKRYEALAERLQGLDNWSGHVGNIQDIMLDRTFDVVTVIGVLEYAELYMTPPPEFRGSAFDYFLHKAAAFLKEDGVLVVAIENRLGLKYWNGAAEDHSGGLFDGICGYPAGKSAKTFSRRELIDLLATAGLKSVEEHFPFPDYKVPSTVITRALAESQPALAAGLATTRSYRNYGQPRVRYYPEILAVESVARAGLLPEMANSFLFMAARSQSSPTWRWLLGRSIAGERAWHYSLRRRFPVLTVFGEGGAWKHALDGEADAREVKGESLRVRWEARKETVFAEGTFFRQAFARRAHFEGKDAAYALLKDFLSWSLGRWSANGGKELRGEALDALVANAVIDGESYVLFDLEWSLATPMPAGWFILRNCVALIPDTDVIPSATPFRSLKELYLSLCRDLGVAPELEKDIAREAELQSLVTHRASKAHYLEAITEAVASPITAGWFPRKPAAEERLMRMMLQSPPAKAVRKILGTARGMAPMRRAAKRLVTALSSM